MRTKAEIKEEAIYNNENAGPKYPHGAAILEVLLDIRELLLSDKQTGQYNANVTFPKGGGFDIDRITTKQ